VFNRNGSLWTQQAYIKSSTTTIGDVFGGSVSISADADSLAVGAVGERSLSTGIGGLQDNGNAYQSDAVFLY